MRVHAVSERGPLDAAALRGSFEPVATEFGLHWPSTISPPRTGCW